MIRHRTPHHAPARTPASVMSKIGRDPVHRVHRHGTTGFFLTALFSIFAASLAMAEGNVSPALLAAVVTQRADQLAAIDSDAAALKLFTTTIGPALGLKDAAGALGARLPSRMVKELGLAELSQSASELMATLATWQFADGVRRDVGSSPDLLSLPAARQEWLRGRSRTTSFSDLLRLAREDQALRTAQPTSPPRNTELLLAAERTAFESSQRATATWWDIHGWKDRIRQAKGQARLCGTWQWIIHNHQIHGEQKSTIIFPPPGQTPAHAATPAETIVLGDAIYLRWEQNGQIQEDSLLFIKDDNKIEGSFMNNTGGWGPISGKRTAPCQP
ncbi:MAG: hypothetical protein A4E19_20825 [Nitrospira sp. SG-bin1]|nr:MAG: hypothetical protein A4E19_20825 [Nitrospira sp. SG-bin1]